MSNLSVLTFYRLYQYSLLPRYRRLILPIILLALLASSVTREIVLTVLADAFWQVAVFVAMTLAIYHLFSHKLKAITCDRQGQSSPLREISVASLMGVLPGCGGAIIIITQYVSGQMSFGAVVAVLTATMGDAAFLLLAAQPLTGLGVICICLCVGMLSGIVVNRLHGADFLRSPQSSQQATPQKVKGDKQPAPLPVGVKWQANLWQWLMLPGALIGLLMAAQVDIATVLPISAQLLQVVGAAIVLTFIFLWATTREVTNYESAVAEDKKTRKSRALQKVALDTNFVTSWVVAGFLTFELLMHFGQIDLQGLFTSLAGVTPLIGVLLGMIPGCGPQIITTSLYLSGAIPLSAQIGNAISNDGDALFPAIALSPRVAVVATFYSAIPALLAAYSYYWLFE